LSFFRFLAIEIFFFVGGKGTAYKINLQYSFVGILNHDVFSMKSERISLLKIQETNIAFVLFFYHKKGVVMGVFFRWK